MKNYNRSLSYSVLVFENCTHIVHIAPIYHKRWNKKFLTINKKLFSHNSLPKIILCLVEAHITCKQMEKKQTRQYQGLLYLCKFYK